MSSAENQRHELWSWGPLGLWLGTLLAILRSGALLSAQHRAVVVSTEAQDELFRWSIANSYPEVLLECLVLGLIAAALAHRALSDGEEDGPRAGRKPLFVFTIALLLCGLSGWPLSAPSNWSTFHGELALDDLGIETLLALGGTALLFAGMRWGAGRILVDGRAAMVLATLSMLAAYGGAWSMRINAPTFELKSVQRNWMEEWDKSSDLIRVLDSNALAEPHSGILTPAVEVHTDSADKPALIMTPPCKVELTIPQTDAGEFLFRASVGIDKSVGNNLVPKQGRFAVRFTVAVNGEEHFSEVIETKRNEPYSQTFAKSLVWRHVDARGDIRVRAGDRITLSTSIPPGNLAAQANPALLKVGFGGIRTDRVYDVRRQRATPQTPNIVFIVMDTLRRDRLSCYGYERVTTPNIDDLASQGTMFKDAYATSSWTWPSTASMLTGLTTEAHGVVSNAACTLNYSLTTVAEALQARGYTTAGFSCNPLIAAERNYDQGFETFENPRSEFRMSDEVMPDILRWVDGNHQSRFFLYLHLADPHAPHRPHPEELERLGIGKKPDNFPSMQALVSMAAQVYRNGGNPLDAIPLVHQQYLKDEYDASVATGDRYVGEFLRRLERHGLMENTIIAFTSDHGEELFDHQLLAHGHTVHAELVRVPLIIAGPGIEKGVVIEQPVSNRHIGPTLARLGGSRLEGMEDGDARFLLEPELEPEPILFGTTKGFWNQRDSNRIFGIREGDWILHFVDPPSARVPYRLFEVISDPLEHVPRTSMEDQVQAKNMWRKARDLIEKHETFKPAYQPGLGEATLQMLKGNGYVGDEEEEDD